MKAMTKLAEDEGVILLHENEKDIYGESAKNCLEIMREVNSPALKCVFDPANFVQCGQQTFPDAFNMLKPYIEYMHIKDAKADKTVVPAGAGIGEVEKIIKALYENGYNGFLSLEPHLGSFSGLENLEQDDSMLSLPKSSADKFTLAYTSLVNIIERVEK